MKTTQYVRQEKAIAAADKGGIRERWMWGLRLLRDDEKMTESKKSLKHGATEVLIAAAKKAGLTLSATEIRRRLICARTYKTEAEIIQAMDDFKSWFDLSQANFPAYDAPDGEPPADHRTDAEREHARARALLDLIGEQGSFFPASDFEPVTTTLKELQAYTEEMEELTARFVERDRKRRAYLDSLIEAADNDLSMTWQEAQERLDADGADEPTETGAAA